MVEALGLTRRYGARLAVDGLTFAIPRGSIAGFLGPNGAGKTTTLRMLVGVLPPTSGRISINGIDLGERPIEARRQIGYLPESSALNPELRVDEFLRFRGRLHGLGGRTLRRGVDAVIDRCLLGPVRRRLIGALSKGFRQRTGLAAALLHDPAVLILDEPSSGLDPAQLLEFRAILRSLAGTRTVLLSSHVLPEIEAVCDRVLMIAAGRLVAFDTLEGLRRRGGLGGRLLVECAGDALALLSAVPGVAECRVIGREGRWVRHTIAAIDSGADLRETIARQLVAANVLYRELAPCEPTLEELFIALSAPEWAP